MAVRLLTGDCRTILPTLAAQSVHCVVTSPPYWGLRDYGTVRWEGGDVACDHRYESRHQKHGASSVRPHEHREYQRNDNFRGVCGDCGAQRVDAQIGLEPTPEEYVAALVGVFRGLRRVLRDDGTVWLNLGDSYNAWNGNRGPSASHSASADEARPQLPSGAGLSAPSLKAKDLVGIPWRVAFALQADGWWLRSDIIWSKPACMPESVTDRPTKSHEYVFLLAKSERYFYDADAIREEGKDWSRGGPGVGIKNTAERYGAGNGGNSGLARLAARYKSGERPAGRNKRTVWTITPRPFKGAHFAVFPPALVEPCILAGTSEKGTCPTCGAPWRRQKGRTCDRCQGFIAVQAKACPSCGHVRDWKAERGLSDDYGTTDWSTPGRFTPRRLTAEGKQAGVGHAKTHAYGWEPGCDHGGDPVPVPGTILDTFGGSGTVGEVATALGRHAVLIELNPAYVKLAEARTAQQGLFSAKVGNGD